MPGLRGGTEFDENGGDPDCAGAGSCLQYRPTRRLSQGGPTRDRQPHNDEADASLWIAQRISTLGSSSTWRMMRFSRGMFSDSTLRSTSSNDPAAAATFPS